jgi:hypothetical protein
MQAKIGARRYGPMQDAPPNIVKAIVDVHGGTVALDSETVTPIGDAWGTYARR